MRFRASLLATTALIVCLACGSDTTPIPAGDIVHRWVADDPTRILDTSDLYDLEPVFRWSFTDPKDQKRMSVAESRGVSPQGLEYRPAARRDGNAFNN